MKLFTYGTLRRGERNHFVLPRQARFIKDDFISAAHAGSWWDIPLIKEDPGGTVLGEVYEVPEDSLTSLDIFEGVHQGLYERRKVVTHSGIDVWVYFPGEEILNQG